MQRPTELITQESIAKRKYSTSGFAPTTSNVEILRKSSVGNKSNILPSIPDKYSPKNMLKKILSTSDDKNKIGAFYVNNPLNEKNSVSLSNGNITTTSNSIVLSDVKHNVPKEGKPKKLSKSSSKSIEELAIQGKIQAEKKFQPEINLNNGPNRNRSAIHQSSDNSYSPSPSSPSSAGTSNSNYSISSSSSNLYSVSSSSISSTESTTRRTSVSTLGPVRTGSRRSLLSERDAMGLVPVHASEGHSRSGSQHLKKNSIANLDLNDLKQHIKDLPLFKKESSSRSSSRPPSSRSSTSQLSSLSKDSIKTSSTLLLYLAPKNIVGLANLGNTCFMNSVVQCLLWSPGLIPYFIDNLCENGNPRAKVICETSPLKGNLAKAFASLLKECINVRSGSYVSPQTLKKVIAKWAPQFVGYEQHDSQEFMHYLLDGLGEDLNRNNNDERMQMRKLNEAEALAPDEVKEKWDIQKLADDAWYRYSLGNNSIITDLFTGQLLSKLQCRKCGYISYCVDPFLDVSLPIPTQPSTQTIPSIEKRGITGAGYTSNDFRKRSVSLAPSHVELESCFRHFNSREILDGDEKVKCVRCKERQETYKTLYLHRLPPLLVVHIKRFSNLGYRRKKLDTTITGFRSIDVRPFLHDEIKTNYKGGTLYDLYGVSNHMGSLAGGHYTASCKTPDGSSGSTIIRKTRSASISHTTRRQSSSEKESDWHLFDDSRTSPISDLSGSAAYLLFYKRR